VQPRLERGLRSKSTGVEGCGQEATGRRGLVGESVRAPPLARPHVAVGQELAERQVQKATLLGAASPIARRHASWLASSQLACRVTREKSDRSPEPSHVGLLTVQTLGPTPPNPDCTMRRP